MYHFSLLLFIYFLSQYISEMRPLVLGKSFKLFDLIKYLELSKLEYAMVK